jgi:hypothetical protein
LMSFSRYRFIVRRVQRYVLILNLQAVLLTFFEN